MDNTIIFIMGVSGAGKGTLLDGLLSTYPNFSRVKSYTSRQARPGEIIYGIYNFITEEEFKKDIVNGEFLEYALIHNRHFSGTKKKDIMEKIRVGLVPIKEIDIHGLKKLKREQNPPFNYFSIFLDIPEELMIHRIHGRGKMDYKELENRIQSSYLERKLAQDICDYTVDASGTKEQTLAQVSNIIDEHFMRYSD